mmetsp:Transcript_68492/g.191954  ORF Transcript_68492/g.191954 Transcript_68492/m.191954 type:complete len:85 (-) Transcript_68492:196-450(-)
MQGVSGGDGSYPSRLGEPACAFFVKTGSCKFGATCKFDHPTDGAGAAESAPGGGEIRPPDDADDMTKLLGDEGGYMMEGMESWT